MNSYKHPLFLLALSLFLFNQVAEHFHYYLPFIHSYLDDLLFFPIILTPALSILRMLHGNSYTLSAGKILFTLAYVSLVMEVVLPYFSRRFIGDPLDVVMYASGVILFYTYMNNSTGFSAEDRRINLRQEETC
ncbi:MAG: hypothetical protein ABIO46_09450 [Chitinophagales bacterium]